MRGQGKTHGDRVSGERWASPGRRKALPLPTLPSSHLDALGIVAVPVLVPRPVCFGMNANKAHVALAIRKNDGARILRVSARIRARGKAVSAVIPGGTTATHDGSRRSHARIATQHKCGVGHIGAQVDLSAVLKAAMRRGFLSMCE